MHTGGEAADQIVRMSLAGVEVAARITGTGAKNIAILLYTILKQEGKTRGKARLTSMLRSGRELKVFTVQQGDLKKFIQEAKKYGVLYCVLTNPKNKDPKAQIDIMVRAEDAPKINRIVELFELASVDTAAIVTKAEQARDHQTKAAPVSAEKQAEKDKLMDALLGSPLGQEEGVPENPLPARTEKSPLSEPFSKMPEKSAEGAIRPMEKPSVKEELRKIKAGRKQEQDANKPDRQNPAGKRTPSQGKAKSSPPLPKKKPNKSRETR